MKDIKITKEQAINIISNILREGCAIPQASDGNGGAGFGYVDSDVVENSYDELVSWLRGMSFSIVPTSEISEEFSDMNLDDYDDYDVCVEFTNSDRGYSEQYLLWDIDHYKD